MSDANQNPYGQDLARGAGDNPYSDAEGPFSPPAGFGGLGIAALILGAFAFLVAWIPFLVGLVLSFVPTVLAITFGIIDVSSARKRGRSSALGLAGLILGGLVFLGWFTGLGTLW